MFQRVMQQVSARLPIANQVRYCTSNPVRVEKTLNQVTLLGRAGIDPQKRGSLDHPVVIFTLATHHNYRYETGEVTQKTDWHRVSVFKPSLRDKVHQYLTKGQRVMVTGRLTYGEYKDEEQNLRNATTIIADDVIFFASNNAALKEATE